MEKRVGYILLLSGLMLNKKCLKRIEVILFLVYESVLLRKCLFSVNNSVVDEICNFMFLLVEERNGIIVKVCFFNFFFKKFVVCDYLVKLI